MSKMSRGRKTAIWIVLLALAVSGLAGGGAWYFISKANEAKRNLADLIAEDPGATAAAAYTFDDEGEIVDDGNAVFHNADEPLVVASTMKVVILAAYAEAVVSGDLDPNEQIPIADLEQYYLPLTDGGAHARGLRSVGLRADDDGFARDRSARVRLDDLARIMIHYSGNAETDYLITRLGADRIASLMQTSGLEEHTPIRPTIGVALAIFNHEVPSLSGEQLEEVIAAVSRGDTSPLDRLTALYVNDPQWRAAQIAFMRSLEEREADNLDMWRYQTEASQLLPHGTAREYAEMMARIASGRFISPEVDQIVQQKLETVRSDWPLRLLFFERFGGKDGVTAGVLALASYAVPRRGPLSDDARVVVIIANSLQLEDWAQQLQYQGHYLLLTDLARATGVFSAFSGKGDDG
jgi:D-alanyl-D-alanine carboxypeptidase